MALTLLPIPILTPPKAGEHAMQCSPNVALLWDFLQQWVGLAMAASGENLAMIYEHPDLTLTQATVWQ